MEEEISASGIQHFAFARRQWALNPFGGGDSGEENERTAKAKCSMNGAMMKPIGSREGSSSISWDAGGFPSLKAQRCMRCGWSFIGT